MRNPTEKEISAVGAITFDGRQKNPRLVAKAACKAFIAVSGTEGSMEVHCPFCDEGDFDLSGLKYHLLTWCENYDDIDI